MKLKFLGTADSGGIPIHNCDCIACEAYRAENKVNLSTSAYIQTEEGVILIDAGLEDISTIFDGQKILGIVLTHFHADHCLGLLRLRYSKDSINCYHPKDRAGFSDLFKYEMAINYIENFPLKSFNKADIKFTPIPIIHSKSTTGYLIETGIKTIAYLTDCRAITDQIVRFLQESNIDTIFIEAGQLPEAKKRNHLDYISATEVIERIGAKEGFLIHKSHKVERRLIEEKPKLKYPFVEKGFTLDLN